MTDELSIQIEREFKANKTDVWNHWTKDELIEKWYGPKGFTTQVEKNEFTIDGEFEFVMISPNGHSMPIKGKYLEIDDLDKFVTVNVDDGNSPMFMEMVTTTIVEEIDENSCKLIVIMTVNSLDEKEKMLQMGVKNAWEGSFEKLDECLANN